jgi:nucleoside-diphosphate-sugar epimerase
VIVGAGPIGTATATQLLAAGHDVRIVSRRGRGPDGVERVAADARDATRLTELAGGAQALYNCANPPYHRWPVEWPPLAEALLTAAERSGAVLVTMSNLYGYGPVRGAMTEDLPLAATTRKGQVRARMWADALAAHRCGRVRVTEARASDFVGGGAQSLFIDMIAPAVLRGRGVLVPANVDLPHSLTYTGDAARTLATLGTHEAAWGRAWHVPTAEPTTLREAARRLGSLVDAAEPRLRHMPAVVLRAGGLFSPVAREFVEMRYQFEAPFVLDSSAAQATFGLAPTPLDDALRTMV